MGEIKQLLSSTSFYAPSYFSEDLRVEVSEAIHIHWRDTRILLTVNQFKAFVHCLDTAYGNWNRNLSDLDILLQNTKLPDDVIFKQSASLEEQVNGCIHFHYNDVRLELKISDFLNLAVMFKDAHELYVSNNFKETMIPLNSINPYDHIHFPTKEQWLGIEGHSKEYLKNDWLSHKDGIHWMATQIAKGHQIEPILVTVNSDGSYQRRDGFKRYMACKRLRYDLIPCYVVSEEIALSCPQHKKPPFRCI